MTSLIMHNPKYPSCQRKQRIHDVMIVSSFAVWAILIGFTPVLAVHLVFGA